MSTDLSASPLSPVSTVVAGLVVVGLGVWAYTQGAVDTRGGRGGHDDTGRDKAKVTETDKGRDKGNGDGEANAQAQKGEKRHKDKGPKGGVEGKHPDGTKGVAGDGGQGKLKPKLRRQDKGGERVDADGQGRSAAVVPGGFDTASSSSSSSPSPSLAGTTSRSGQGVKSKKKTKKKSAGKAQGKGAEAPAGRAAAGDTTDADASVSLSPSVGGSRASPGVVPGKAEELGGGARLVPPSVPRDQARVHAPSQAREAIRPSLSFDTDGSWTHVDRRRMKTSTDGQIGRPVDAMDATSSDLASTESNSPVVDRMEGVASDIHGTRADLAKRTLAEKLVPRPEETSVDDMLEQPNFPALARVMRVRPQAGETPVPGFSWEDYGDVVEESLLVHDADQEDEGEWGIVKSRNRTRPAQTQTVTSTVQAAAPPEAMTQKQRQNARKRELAKAVKAEQEAARLQGLAEHKRELERLRIIEQSRQGGGKRPSGGMHATVDDRGKLVWE